MKKRNFLLLDLLEDIIVKYENICEYVSQTSNKGVGQKEPKNNQSQRKISEMKSV